MLRPGGELFEIVPDDVLQFVGRSESRTVRGYVDALRKAKVDTRVAAVLLAPRALTSPFWGKVQELREAVVDFKTSGKPVYAFLEYGGDREYYLATAADKIFLLPTATLDVTGVATYEVFLRGTLDWVGAYPDLLHIGDYKTAINIFTEKTFTPAHKEMSAALNRDQFDQLVRAIADGRRKSEAEVRTAIDEGPLLPEDALRHGLVDDLAYEDELDDLVQEVGGPGKLKLLESDDYAERVVGIARRAPPQQDCRAQRRRRDHAGARAASIRSTARSSARTRSSNTSARSAATRRSARSSLRDRQPWRCVDGIRRDLARADDHQERRAQAADHRLDVRPRGLGRLLHRDGRRRARRAARARSPARSASTPASSSPAARSTSSAPTSKPTSNGRHAEIYSPDRRFTPRSGPRCIESMQAFYDQFVEKVAEARHTSPEKIDQIAQGRVWTGQQAQQVGLVDQLGGLQVAVAVAKQRARIPAEEEVELVVYPPRRSFYEVLSEQFDSRRGSIRPARPRRS